MMTTPLGPHLHAFFVDDLATQKGLRTTSIRSYRDALRLLLAFVAKDTGRALTRLTLGDLTFDRMLAFLKHLEHDRHNAIETRNQRLAALHTFFASLARRVPEMLDVAQRVAAIPTKRAAPPPTRYLERDEINTLFAQLPHRGRRALRDRVLLLTLYNTGARVQEIADLRVEHLDLRRPARVHDLRHSFAVGTLLRWYRAGVDPTVRLPHLSTFLGHSNPNATAVYLTITEELFQAANQRFAAFAPPLSLEVAP